MSIREDIEDAMAELQVLHEQMQHQNDRVAAIACAAWLDDMLGAAISTKFIRLGEDWKKSIFDSQGAPLSTMSGKIRIGYALGVFGPKTRADLDKIREVRNKFAHSSGALSFNDPALSVKCMALYTSRMSHPRVSGVALGDAATPKDHYIQSALRISGKLLMIARSGLKNDRPKHPDGLP